MVVPVLEAPDEPSHVAVVRYLSTHHALPSQRPEDGYPVGQEGSQPPFYYALGAVLWGFSPSPELAPTWANHNPFVTFERSTQPLGNRVLYAHPAQEDFPYRGDILGIHLVRLLGVVFGAITVALSYAIARDLFPGRPWVAPLAAALIAFNPEFTFLSGVVNNDNAIAATSTLVLWCLVRWWTRGKNLGLAVLLGASLAAAILSKTGGALLLGPVGVVLVTDWIAERRSRTSIGLATLVGAIALLLAGWWFVRNQLLYGDPLGWNAMLAVNSSMLRSTPFDPLAAAAALWNARGTFWGAFGWTNVLYDEKVYRYLDAAIPLGGIGLLSVTREAWRQKSYRAWVLPVTILGLWPALVFGSLVRWVQVNEAADQWRLVFPAIASIAILLAIGIDELRRFLATALGRFSRIPTASPAGEVIAHRFGRGLSVVIVAIGMSVNVWVLTHVVAPQYYPVVSASDDVSASSVFHFGANIDLLEARVTPARISPGDDVDVELVWRARNLSERNLSVKLSVMGDANQPIALVQSWPQSGTAPTSTWRPGQVIRDRYHFTPRWQSDEPKLAPVWLSLYDSSTLGGPSLLVTDTYGRSAGTGIVIGQLKLDPTESPAPKPPHALDATFGSSIALIGYGYDWSAASDSLHVTLYWRDLAPVPTGYTVFVHVADASGRVLAQQDGPPSGGRYPTDVWDSGDVVRDEHDITLGPLPAGPKRVLIGLYRPSDGQRLQVKGLALKTLGGDAVELFDLAAMPGFDPSGGSSKAT